MLQGYSDEEDDEDDGEDDENMSMAEDELYGRYM